MSETTKTTANKPETIRKNPALMARKEGLSKTGSSPHDRILQLQRTVGNREVQRLIQSGALQAKLNIGQPNDKYEQEADRVADKVMSMPEPGKAAPGSRSSINSSQGAIARQEEAEEEPLQTKPIAEQITPLVQRQPEEEEEPLQTKSIQRQEDEEEEVQTKIQRQGNEEEEPVQTKSIQRQENEEEEPIQPKSIQRQETEEEEVQAKLQRQAEEEEEPIQTKSSANQSQTAPPSVESGINSLKGGGQPLSASTRSYFEPRFGTDFSQVRLHTDSQAAETASTINAKAFTTGKDVVFGSGQYSPGTSSGKRLLAHELTHMLQQKGHQRIHRKILINGKYFNPKREYVWIRKHYGQAMVEFLSGMHNKGKPPEFKFDNFGQMHKEVRVRYYATKGMKEVNKGASRGGCCDYPAGRSSYLDTTYWQKLAEMKFKVKSPLPPRKKPSDAIEAIFKPKAGTLLECNSLMVAIQYQAMLKALGAKIFNEKFPNGRGIIISPHHKPPRGVTRHPIWQKRLFKQQTISGEKDLLPGDWVYFKNFDDYSTFHRGEPWGGEHALYMGNGKYQGFGPNILFIKGRSLTKAKVEKELCDKYNEGLQPANQKSCVPTTNVYPFRSPMLGLRNYVRRPEIKEIEKH